MNLEDAVKLAILNIRKESITDVDVFKRPFEIDYLSEDRNYLNIFTDVTKRLKGAFYKVKNNNIFESLKELKLSPLKILLIPKKNLFDFRKSSYTEILDEIIYLSLVLMIANKIEKQRIAKNKETIFSYRLKRALLSSKTPTFLFDYKYSYTRFRSNISKKAQENNAKVIISCDISNFYDRLNLHRLENTLLSIPEINTDVVKLINEILLFWSNRDSYGLPVGSNASRILAEASLIDVDKYLMERNIIFSRFVDDFRLFAKDAKEAHTWLSILVERLNQEGLFLNTHKTTIASITEIKQNSINKNDVEIDKNELPVVIRGYSGIIPTKFRKLSTREIENLKSIDVKVFTDEKILIDIIDPEDLKKYIRALIAQEDWVLLTKVSKILNRFPQFIPYYLDCIDKHRTMLGTELLYEIEEVVKELSNDSSLLEYLRIYILRFLAGNIQCTKHLLNIFLNLKRGEGIYLGRSILENIGLNLNRNDVLEIKKGYQRADATEKRIILKIMKQKLNPKEFKAFYKNISLVETDPWLPIIVSDARIN